MSALGLAILLIAWGADYFWRSRAQDDLKTIEFITINSGIVENNSELHFIKYLAQDRKDPKLLSLDYRNRLQSLQATCALLGKSGVVIEGSLQNNIQELYSEVCDAYEKGISLEPRDIGKNIRSDIVNYTTQVQLKTQKHILKSAGRLKIWSRIFAVLYAIGSIIIIINEACRT